MRYPLVIGNWKLNGSKHMVNEFIEKLCNELSGIVGCGVAIAPPVMYLDLAKQNLTGSCIALGAQNVDTNLSGAFTGEISANMLKDIGAKYIIIGHSERRIYHKESNKYIAEKFVVLKESSLIPVLCIGESEAENKAGQTKAVCALQLDAILNRMSVDAFNNTIIAYEPIWAIGTGNSATPEYVQDVHKFIRSYIANHNTAVAEKIIIQYGGSVNTSNALQFFIQPDIDGALVGGASLIARDFAVIIKAATKAKKPHI